MCKCPRFRNFRLRNHMEKPWLLLEAQQGLIVESCCFVLANPAGHSNCLDETLNPEPPGHKCNTSGDRSFKPQTSSQEPVKLEPPIPHHAMRFSRVLLAYFFQDLVQKMVWGRDLEQGFCLGAGALQDLGQRLAMMCFSTVQRWRLPLTTCFSACQRTAIAFVTKLCSDLAEPSGSSPKRVERSSCQSWRIADSDNTTPLWTQSLLLPGTISTDVQACLTLRKFSKHNLPY